MDLANLLHGAAPAPKVYSETYGKRSMQAPLSPPVEDQPKCSLPSISTLLEGADGAQHAAKRQRLSPPLRERDTRYDSVCLPPTPPLRPGSGSGHRQSPLELGKSDLPHRASVSSTTSSSAPHISRAGPYASPAPSVSSSYTSPVEAPPSQSNNLYYARPPPTTASPTVSTPTSTTFQPAPSVTAPPMPTQQPPAPSPALISPVTPAWQHHHYFPPSSSAPYQQNHDRYICRTCHKAFSRPSSLRIHSHSHTGEKPFRCTHAGCGKAFSVRSNMKRHERGCHSGRPVAPPAPTTLVS
ncbi:C2H2 finger domain transcription factor mtfA [Penicillium macrosclerotiorum]|uniref:C2H2 finger domain transcription factor mtfA n=1 Tax=Penicillium macrosclerotiorum TaxID=303699 RepID=UPI00254692F2|nr:C2H2 finger domain transcription factor mtfA [Penicillium macrosclerotiorum]KAJ5699014.1 C2H2 finger domain transcription factor mtfA [Penicillium macrosclerotiorum]